jgi:hypothetical protein
MDALVPTTTTVAPTTVEVQTSGVAWTAVVAGAAVSAALSLVLIALGAGLGLLSVSPWPGSGVSGTTFVISTGIYLCVVAVMASSVGGYMATRLRTRWVGLHTNEVFFRDTAHGLLAWAVATLFSVLLLGSVATQLVTGAAQGIAGTGTGPAAQAANPAGVYVDRLLRPVSPTPVADNAAPANGAVRAELLRLWTSSFERSGDLSGDDRTYVAQLVAARTGLNQSDALRRVNDVINDAKAAADSARKAGIQFSFWLTAALLFGAFAASLAAVEGGQLRDGSWHGRVLTPRALTE